MENHHVLSKWKDIRVKKEALILALAFLLITAMFALFPLPGGDDWGFFRSFIHRLIQGESMYAERYNGLPFYYPPWVGALLVPFGALPSAWGRAFVTSLTLLLTILMCRRFKLSPIQQAMVLLSPPMLYIFLHGQIDVLALAVFLLPRHFWLIGSITKPQVTIGLIFGLQREFFWKSVGIAAAITLASFIVFGLWPLEMLQQPREFTVMGFNVWGGLWPFQLPLGFALVFRAMQKNDDRYLIASSPFFLPYAATSSLIGPWIALSSMLEDWQAVVVLVVWWAASFSRLL